MAHSRKMFYALLSALMLLLVACSEYTAPTTQYLGSVEVAIGESGLEIQNSTSTFISCAGFSFDDKNVDESDGFHFTASYAIDASRCPEALDDLLLVPLNLASTVGNSPLITRSLTIPIDIAVAESLEYPSAVDISAQDVASLSEALTLRGEIIPKAFVGSSGTFSLKASETFNGGIILGIFSAPEIEAPDVEDDADDADDEVDDDVDGISSLRVEKACDPITTWTGSSRAPNDITMVQGDAAVARAYSCIITVTNSSEGVVANNIIVSNLLPPELGVIETAGRGNSTSTPTNLLTAGGFTYTPSGIAELALALTDVRNVPVDFAGEGTYDDTLHVITWSFREVPQLRAIQPGDSITVGFNFYPRHKPGYVWNDNDQNRTRDGNLERRQTGYFSPNRSPSFNTQSYPDPYFVNNVARATASNTLIADTSFRIHVTRPFLALEKMFAEDELNQGSPSVRGNLRPRVAQDATVRFEIRIQNYDRALGGLETIDDAVSYVRGRDADSGYAELRADFPVQYAQEMTAFQLEVRDIFGLGLGFVNAFDIDTGADIDVNVDLDGGAKTAILNLASYNLALGEARRIGVDVQAIESSAVTASRQHFADAVSFGSWQVRQNDIDRNEQQPIADAWINCVRLGARNLSQQVNIGNENSNIGARSLTTDPTPGIVINVNKIGAPWVYPFYTVPPVQREADHAATNYFSIGQDFLAEYLLDPRPSFTAENGFGYTLENTNPETPSVADQAPKSNGLIGNQLRNVIQDCVEIEVAGDF